MSFYRKFLQKNILRYGILDCHFVTTFHHFPFLLLHGCNIYSRSAGRVGGRQGTITNYFLWPRLTRHIFILWPTFFYAENQICVS